MSPHSLGTPSVLAHAQGRGWPLSQQRTLLSPPWHRSPPRPHHAVFGALLGVRRCFRGAEPRADPSPSRVSPTSPPPLRRPAPLFPALPHCGTAPHAGGAAAPSPRAARPQPPTPHGCPPPRPPLLPLPPSVPHPPRPAPGAESPFCCGSRRAGKGQEGLRGGGRGHRDTQAAGTPVTPPCFLPQGMRSPAAPQHWAWRGFPSALRVGRGRGWGWVPPLRRSSPSVPPWATWGPSTTSRPHPAPRRGAGAPRAALSLHLNESVTSMVAADGQTDRRSWVLRENRLKIAAACVWDVSPEPRQPLKGLRPLHRWGWRVPAVGFEVTSLGSPGRAQTGGGLGISAVARAGVQQPGNQPTQDEMPALGAPESPSPGGSSHGDPVQTEGMPGGGPGSVPARGTKGVDMAGGGQQPSPGATALLPTVNRAQRNGKRGRWGGWELCQTPPPCTSIHQGWILGGYRGADLHGRV